MDMFGMVCYFARRASYSDKYGCDVHDHALPPGSSGKCRAMFLARVLIGEFTVGSKHLYPAPHKLHSNTQTQGSELETAGLGEVCLKQKLAQSAKLVGHQ